MRFLVGGTPNGEDFRSSRGEARQPKVHSLKQINSTIQIMSVNILGSHQMPQFEPISSNKKYRSCARQAAEAAARSEERFSEHMHPLLQKAVGVARMMVY